MDARHDDEFHVGSEERSRSRVPKSISMGKKKVHLSSSSDSSHDEGSGLETDDHETTPSIRQHGKSKSRNGMTLNYDTDDQSLPATRTKETPAPTSHVDDNDDGFMSDCDASPAPPPKKQVKEDTASRYRKVNTYQKDLKTKGRKKRARSTKQTSARNRDSGNYSFGHEKDPGGELEDLHPNFENPKFGPYELEPLLLSNDQVDTVVQVPASLSRYLAPFQKEGVRFMYECLARKSGVILGDEMGCGKTVQVISLLCALFNKTGTRKDFLDDRNRYSLVRKKIVKMQKLRDQALHMGEVVDENIEEWKTSLSLSPWNPVMIIVPPTILDTWKDAFRTFSHFSVSFYCGRTKVDAIESVLYGSADILLVPKSMFQDETHLREFERIKWKLIIIDEFHNFKNHRAKISEHLRSLKVLHQPLVLGMTGTPMQNNHTELWNLVDLIETTTLERKMNLEPI